MNGFLVTVEGDYFGAPRSGERKKEKFPYRIQVKVPTPEGALSLIKNKLLDKVLRRNYDNYFAYRTHQLVSITQVDGSKVYGLTDPRLMDFNDLAQYVKQNNLPLKLELYTDLGYFRTMVHLAQTNQREFLNKQATLQKDCEEDRLLAELNPEILNDAPAQSAVKTVNLEGEIVTAETANKDAVWDNTTIIQGERKEAEQIVQGEGVLNKVVSDPASNMLTEEQPAAQKVDKVYIPGKGFVDVNDFKEDFEKEDEKEFEVYDPTNITPDPSEEGSAAEKIVEPIMTATEAAQRKVDGEKRIADAEAAAGVDLIAGEKSIVDEL